MQSAGKTRLHGVVHALCGAVVFAVGYFAGLRELQWGPPGTHQILYAYAFLFLIGGHLVREGFQEARGRSRTGVDPGVS